MRLLLDTHAFLWLVSTPEKLGPAARRAVVDHENERLLSLASAWELAIKSGLDKIRLPVPVDTYIPDRLARTGTRLLPMSLHHVTSVAHLPPHHGDPFDRMIIVQALVEGLTLVSGDPAMAAYGVTVLWD